MNKFFCFKNLPNILTISRIIFIPIILAIVAIEPLGTIYQFTIFGSDNQWKLNSNITINFLIGGILFVLASITDWLDGFLSRKYKIVSDFGKIWDPIADKILINSIFVLFAYLKIVPWYFAVLIIVRDVIVDGFRMFLSSKNIIFPAKFSGKLKTVMQMFAIIILFFIFNDSSNILNFSHFFIQNLFVIFAVMASLYSC
ncbi:MAG: CDP-diacylglycerol--glycerol-3-phosphate 3-phosphatidyltransferase, partial [Malacoplasma sp.]|nr:CDP-diacylglycerol--glycerol-3-phosphate 3-phosphatidyltransferase [Malacoplasma sp.]